VREHSTHNRLLLRWVFQGNQLRWQWQWNSQWPRENM